MQLTVIDVADVEDRPSTLKLNGVELDPKSAMPLVLLNPELTMSDETDLGLEGCLSFPEITADIWRASSVVLRAQTLEGETVEIEASGLLARALQHEVDHLNGILFIDRMSAATKVALRSRLKRMQKENAARCNVDASLREARELATQTLTCNPAVDPRFAERNVYTIHGLTPAFKSPYTSP